MYRKIVLAFLLALPLAAQTHTVTLAWVDSINPATTTYNVYRGSGACTSTTPPATKITLITLAPLATKTYQDSVTPGVYCYAVTAVSANEPESPQSAAATATVPLAAPTGLTVVVNP